METERTHRNLFGEAISVRNKNFYSQDAIRVENDSLPFDLERNVLHNTNFVALDFETATPFRNSICEIGLTVVKDGILCETKTWRVQPPNNQYNRINIGVHGIRPEDTINCKTFHELWPEVSPYLENQLLVMHNSAFDSYVLYDSLLAHSIPFPSCVFVCSYQLAKRTFTSLSEFGLSALCFALDIPFTQHHNAGADAAACAEVFLRILRENATETYGSLLENHDYNIGCFSPNYFRPFKKEKYSSSPCKKTPTAKKSNELFNLSQIPEEARIFSGKTICFTGESPIGKREKMHQIAIALGATPQRTVTRATDFLIVGFRASEELSTKNRKALDMQDKGHGIKIMPIEEFMAILHIRRGYHDASKQ